MPPAAPNAADAAADQAKPNDARTIEAILHTMGVDDYDPRVTHQLLELLYRYTSCVLTEARTFAEHAEKPAIDQDDIKLAVRSRSSFTFTQPPPRDIAMQLAAERNAIPLPPVDQRAGIALPRDVLNLTRHNFRVVRPRPRDASPDPAAKRPPKRPRLPATGAPPRAPRDAPAVIDLDSAAAGQVAAPAATNGAAAATATGATAAQAGSDGGTAAQPMDIVDLDSAPS